MIVEIVLPEATASESAGANGSAGANVSAGANGSAGHESGLNTTSAKVPQGGANVLPALFDINMMMLSGRERTESEWRVLLGSVGLKVTRIQGPEQAGKQGGWTMDSVIEVVVETEA